MQIMDVTLRESVYYGKGLSNEDALNYLQKLKENISNKWIQLVEIGYINNDEATPLNYDEDYFNNALDICDNTYKVTAMMHIPKADISKWNPDVIKRLFLVRVVVGQHIPDQLSEYIDYMHRLGVKLSVNITYVAGMSNEKIAFEIKRAREMGADYIFCADSSGSFSTNMTNRISKLLLDNCGHMVAGLHLHDHMQMATANALAAQNFGISMIDVSVTGAGKGGGNLKMEQGLLVLYGVETISYELLHGLYNMILYFSKLIGRNGDFYVKNMVDFLTGLYRLSLKDTDKLEEECGVDFDQYIRLVTERYNPFTIE